MTIDPSDFPHHSRLASLEAVRFDAQLRFHGPRESLTRVTEIDRLHRRDLGADDVLRLRVEVGDSLADARQQFIDARFCLCTGGGRGAFKGDHDHERRQSVFRHV